MRRKTCPSCGRPTGSAGGMCDPCRLGVPLGTEGLQVEYPPVPKPPLRDRIARLLRGPVAICFYTLVISAILFLIAVREPSIRPWYIRIMGGATGLSLLILLVHVFTSLDFLDALFYFRREHVFHRDGSVDARPWVVFTILCSALLLGCIAFGIP